MTQKHATLAAPSPCINVCALDAVNGLCQGCLRTIDEISFWSRASNEEKWTILSTVERRREALGQ